VAVKRAKKLIKHETSDRFRMTFLEKFIEWHGPIRIAWVPIGAPNGLRGGVDLLMKSPNGIATLERMAR
jgi:hypothetical protein